METRACTKCGTVYPRTLEYFHVHKQAKDGLQPRCRECLRATQKAWQVEHAEEHRASARKYAQEHRENILARNRRYYAEHREEMNAASRRYYQEHREDLQAYNQQYYVATAEDRRAYARQYREEHHEQVLATSRRMSRLPHRRMALRAEKQRRRAQKIAAGGTHTGAQLKEQIQRQKGRCYYCQVQLGTGPRERHVEHVIPLSRGGTNDIGNIVWTCQACNLSKHNRLPIEWAKGGRLL